MRTVPTIKDIREAHQVIRPFVHRTPVLTCSALNHMCEAELFFKCENFQKGGAFKIRGATNAVFALDDGDAARGVATHSSGNHAAALALAARWRGIKAYVVIPENAPETKKNAVANYGAQIYYCGPTAEAREEACAEVLDRTGATFIHSYNDPRIISGAGTAAVELCEEVPDLDLVVTPVGGGGLISGTALAVFAMSPKTVVIGAEPQQADNASRCLEAGRIVPPSNRNTVADGLRMPLCELTLSIIKEHVREVVTVSEQMIVQATRHIWERMKLVVEPSSAVPVGALLARSIGLPGRRIGVILTGGNVDLANLPWK